MQASMLCRNAASSEGMDTRIIALVIALILGGCVTTMVAVMGQSHSAITISRIQAHTGASHE
jgi:hypothetical protein